MSHRYSVLLRSCANTAGRTRSLTGDVHAIDRGGVRLAKSAIRIKLLHLCLAFLLLRPFRARRWPYVRRAGLRTGSTSTLRMLTTPRVGEDRMNCAADIMESSMLTNKVVWPEAVNTREVLRRKDELSLMDIPILEGSATLVSARAARRINVELPLRCHCYGWSGPGKQEGSTLSCHSRVGLRTKKD